MQKKEAVIQWDSFSCCNLLIFDMLVSQQDVKSDHCFIKVSLKRSVSAFCEPVVAQIAFKAFDHAFYRRPVLHDGLESFCHWRVAGVDVGEHIEWDANNPACF
jgi:hypothetical protein